MVNLAKRSKQETGAYCGPAVIQMLVRHLGKEISQVEIVEACEAKKSVMSLGIPLVDLASGVKKLFPGLQVWEKQNSKIEDIEELIANGYPMAVDWQGIFTADEYGDEILVSRNKFQMWLDKFRKIPVAVGDQGHYCIAVELNSKSGYLKFVDPYGHYAGKERFVAIWEFEERWWDDRVGKDEVGKDTVIMENRLMFLVTTSEDNFPETVEMKRV